MITRTSINDPFTITQKRRSDVKCRSNETSRRTHRSPLRDVCMCVYVYVCVEAQKNFRYARATDAECKSARMRFSAIKRHTDSFSPSLANAVAYVIKVCVCVCMYDCVNLSVYTCMFSLSFFSFFLNMYNSTAQLQYDIECGSQSLSLSRARSLSLSLSFSQALTYSRGLCLLWEAARPSVLKIALFFPHSTRLPPAIGLHKRASILPRCTCLYIHIVCMCIYIYICIYIYVYIYISLGTCILTRSHFENWFTFRLTNEDTTNRSRIRRR